MQNLSLREKNNYINYNYKNFHSLVEALKYKHLSLWWDCKADFPEKKMDISPLDKFINERKLEGFRKKFRNQMDGISSIEEIEKTDLYDKILSLIREVESEIIGYENRCIDFFIEKGYSNVTDMFLKEAVSFDSNINAYDIFQAIRNVWIMNSIQILLDCRVSLTPSIFSYSMLYPYSDNFLDDAGITAQEKMDFNSRFRKRLEGKEIKASNLNEGHVFELVERIESEFAREKFPRVFDSLLAIHSGQEKSIIQQRGRHGPHENDIIGISFEKGGTSVLADGFLVKGELSIDEADFMFGYGVFLQLIDDLQDVKVDLDNQHMTIFSQLAEKWPLDRLVNKLLNFIELVLESSNIFTTEESKKLKKVIHHSCIIMILEAISKNKRMFTRKYIKEIEKISMFRLTYFKKLKKKFQRNYSGKDVENICKALKQKKASLKSLK